MATEPIILSALGAGTNFYLKTVLQDESRWIRSTMVPPVGLSEILGAEESMSLKNILGKNSLRSEPNHEVKERS